MSDVVNALQSVADDLQWNLLECYGRGREEAAYPGGRPYVEFVAAVEDGLVPLSWNDVVQIGLATAEVYDFLIVGSTRDSVVNLTTLRDPNERFKSLATLRDVVAECVDSGFWRISIRDDAAAERVIDALSSVAGTIVEKAEPQI